MTTLAHDTHRRAAQWLAGLLLALLLAACGSGPKTITRDGAEANPPANLGSVADAEPRIEPIRSGGPNRPYEVLGRNYVPMTQDRAFKERGLASWYGRKFHGRRTASGETYDMYAMTAAHPTLPIPSYARVRNPANGREVIVRINDRGPFVDGRVIDLSYVAAYRLGVLAGVAPVELVRLTNEMIARGAAKPPPTPPPSSSPTSPPSELDPLGSMLVERGLAPAAQPRRAP